MNSLVLFGALLFVVLAFGYYVLALMNLASLFVAIPLFILSLLFIVLLLNGNNRFKGFK